jgi:2-dehydro-3-deoxygalactonokinase
MPADEPARAAVLGVDWGTTHRRAYLLDGDGACVREVVDAEGMLAAQGRFEASLATLLAALGVEASIPVLMSGMVGSAQGWVEVPYLDVAKVGLRLARLRDHLVAVPGGPRRIAIVPGVRLCRGERVDVMRGEETQLLGAALLGHADGWFVLPGTHSKWAQLRGGAIVDFATYLTGELYALLGREGTLAAAMGEGDAHDPAAFERGVGAAASGAALSNALFGVRAGVVGGAMRARDARSYLSGLLIGAEWHDLKRRCGGRWPARVTLIGEPDLAARHADAARFLGVALRGVDPRKAYLAALAALNA